jgi:hypothetical protein
MKRERPSLNSMLENLALLTETQREQLMLAIEQLKTPTTKTSAKITQLAGLGKEMWQQVDVEKYIQDLRDEWGDRKIR